MEVAFPFNQDLKKIFALLNYNCRLVGGCVRDFILFNKVVEDIDIATPYLPEEVIALLEPEFVVLKTGLKHGTVTIIGDLKYEITTLRKDEKTDGRHAIVSFNSSYEDDAKRRDFTMNALYYDYNGMIYDYLDGLSDLKDKRIKFIGDAFKRIEEDYLRILRFFRFSFRFGSVDSEGLEACYKLKNGLLNISKERVTQEWFKIISGKFFWQFFEKFRPIMDVIGLKNYLNDSINYSKLSELGFTACVLKDNSKLCLSNVQKKYISQLLTYEMNDQTDANLLYNKFGEIFIQDKMIITGKQYQLTKIDPLPIVGSDLLDLGYVGIEVGKILKSLEKEWYASCGTLSKEKLLSLI